jgi:hypothetical protein
MMSHPHPRPTGFPTPSSTDLPPVTNAIPVLIDKVVVHRITTASYLFPLFPIVDTVTVLIDEAPAVPLLLFFVDTPVASTVEASVTVPVAGDVVDPVPVNVDHIVVNTISICINKLDTPVIDTVTVPIDEPVVDAIFIGITEGKRVGVGLAGDIVDPVTVGVMEPVVDAIFIGINKARRFRSWLLFGPNGKRHEECHEEYNEYQEYLLQRVFVLPLKENGGMEERKRRRDFSFSALPFS